MITTKLGQFSNPSLLERASLSHPVSPHTQQYKRLLPGSAGLGKTNGDVAVSQLGKSQYLLALKSIWLLVFIGDCNFWSASVSEIEDKL